MTTNKDDVFTALRHDHDVQRTLMDLVLKTKGDSDGRRELYERLKNALEAHAEAEERTFYAPLLGTKQGRNMAAHSIKEHEEMRELLSELDDIDMSSSAWLAKAKTLVERNHHHIDEEEREVFPLAGRLLSKSEKETMAHAHRSVEGKLRHNRE